MAAFAYEAVGPAAANGWQTGGHEAPIATAAAAWQVAAGPVTSYANSVIPGSLSPLELDFSASGP